jgi:hypothetical protein
MGLSVIKVLDGSIDDEGKLYLNLTCEAVVGMPSVGEMVFSSSIDTYYQCYEILEINDLKNDGAFQMVVYSGGPEFEQDWWDGWFQQIVLGNNTAVCWISIKMFRQLSIHEQHVQLVAFAELCDVGNMTRYVDEKFKPMLKLNLLDGQKVTGLSKLGGLPIASPGFQFPKNSKNQSGIFMCQLDLQEVRKFPAGNEFKGNGILYIFGTLNETGKDPDLDEVMVTYSGSREKLTSIPLPADLERFGVFPETAVAFFEMSELPIDDMRGWIGQTMTPEENDLEEYLQLILNGFVQLKSFSLLRPQTHVQPEYYERAVISHLKLHDHKWLDDNGELVYRHKFLADLGKDYQDSFQWRHLFEFCFKPVEQFTLSNYPGKFSPCTEGHTLMIPQQALDEMDFSKVVLVNMSLGA